MLLGGCRRLAGLDEARVAGALCLLPDRTAHNQSDGVLCHPSDDGQTDEADDQADPAVAHGSVRMPAPIIVFKRLRNASEDEEGLKVSIGGRHIGGRRQVCGDVNRIAL